ncbi:hypothetical protein, partial [Burkholderia sp. SIMBA_052]|uniref:hypothetical protein n=1 Tax=Burkholderia sp. SIMBA_052 TaxID=3085793 RepID=UPI00397A128D
QVLRSTATFYDPVCTMAGIMKAINFAVTFPNEFLPTAGIAISVSNAAYETKPASFFDCKVDGSF